MVQVFSPVSRHVPSAAATARVPGIAPRAGDPPPSSVAALLTRAPSSTIDAIHALPKRIVDAGRLDQRSDDVDLHREAERRRAIDRAERQEDVNGRPPCRAPRPPAASGTTRRCSPEATIASAARGSNSSPRSIAPRRRMASARTVVDRGHRSLRSQAYCRTGRPARDCSMSVVQPALAGLRPLGARHPSCDASTIRRRACLPVGPGRRRRPGIGRVPIR